MKTKLLSLLSVIVFSMLTPLDGLCAPWISSVSPTSGWNEQNTNVTVSGTGFEAGALASLHRSGPDVVGWCCAPFSAHGIWVSGHYAYVATNDGTGVSGSLQVIDVSDPAIPSVVGWCDTPHPASGTYVYGNYAYVADSSSGLHVIDIGDPATPSIVGTCDTPDLAQAVHVSGDYAYVTDRDSGLHVIDVSNPVTPSIVGSCDTPGIAYGVCVSGNYAYVADDRQVCKL